jgi:hypothetical protein
MDISSLSKIGEILIKKQFCTPEQIKQALDVQKVLQIKTKLGAILIELGFVKKEQLEKTLEEQKKDPYKLPKSWKE